MPLAEQFHEKKLCGGGSQRQWQTVLLSVLQQLNGVHRDGVRMEDDGFMRLPQQIREQWWE
jgi:hypothetical protein